MNDIKFLALVVVYKMLPHESNTLRSLAQTCESQKSHIRVIVWDNSPQAYSEADKSELQTLLAGLCVDYRHNGGQNVPLSAIYNRTISEMHDDEYLLLLDDDSNFDASFLLTAEAAIKRYQDIDLFLPVVLNDDQIVSPAIMKGFKGSFFKHVEAGLMACDNVTAINSGMIVNGRYLKHDFEGYDERIKFYFTDNDFMSRYTASHKELVVLDYKIHHCLDFYKKGEPYEVKARRFRELRRSFLILMRRKSLWGYFLTQLYLVVYSVKFSIVQRDVRFLFTF